jgi:hypothetical protein
MPFTALSVTAAKFCGKWAVRRMMPIGNDHPATLFSFVNMSTQAAGAAVLDIRSQRVSQPTFSTLPQRRGGN